jgi:hypothetical protein
LKSNNIHNNDHIAEKCEVIEKIIKDLGLVDNPVLLLAETMTQEGGHDKINILNEESP